jgi:hypothetical protein
MSQLYKSWDILGTSMAGVWKNVGISLVEGSRGMEVGSHLLNEYRLNSKGIMKDNGQRTQVNRI